MKEPGWPWSRILIQATLREGHQSWPCREREREREQDKEMLLLSPPLTGYLNLRPEDELLFGCLACRVPNLMRRDVALNRLLSKRRANQVTRRLLPRGA